jgi:hypothetical protein
LQAPPSRQGAAVAVAVVVVAATAVVAPTSVAAGMVAAEHISPERVEAAVVILPAPEPAASAAVVLTSPAADVTSVAVRLAEVVAEPPPFRARPAAGRRRSRVRRAATAFAPTALRRVAGI